MYPHGATRPFACSCCGGWIPGYSVYEKEVFEGLPFETEPLCDCGQWEEIRDVMLAIFHANRVEVLRRFREAAEWMGLPDAG